jgi:hypothetical protein
LPCGSRHSINCLVFFGISAARLSRVHQKRGRTKCFGNCSPTQALAAVRYSRNRSRLRGSSSFLVQAEAPRAEKSSDFSEIETMLTFFVEASAWSFLIFDQLPCFLYDMRYPVSAGCTKNEEEPFNLAVDRNVPRCQNWRLRRGAEID